MSNVNELNAKLVSAAIDCRFDPLQFVERFFPWGHNELKDAKGARNWQSDVLRDLGQHLSNPATRHTPYRCAIASGHGIGKAQPIDSFVETPSGKRLWGDLKPGDTLFGCDGRPVIIRETHYTKDAPIYRVMFDDGSFCDVSSGHLWNVRGRRERRNNLPGWRTMETIDILEAGVKRSNGVTLARQWEIPVQGCAEFEEREIDLHPYFVGLWLSDGVKNEAKYHKPYLELKERLEGISFYEIITHADGATQYVQGIRHLMTDPVFQCGSSERYIPDDYKYNTVSNRMEMFRGLMDGDGDAHGSGSIGYSTTSLRLAEDVIWLARSLGCKAMLQPTVKKDWYNDEDGKRVDCKNCWRITINCPFNPFTIKHRKAQYKPSEHRYLVRWIESIEPLPNADVMCVSVANPDGLYLANDFIVTHNTALISMVAHWAMSCFPDCMAVITANTEKQLMTKTMPEVQRWVRRSFNAHLFKTTATRVSIAGSHEETWRCDAIPWSENNTEAFAGLHNRGKIIVVIFDEGSAIADCVWETTEGALTDEGTVIVWLAFGNPTRNTGRFRDCFGKYAHRWKTRHIDSRTVEGTNKDLLNQWVQDYGEDSDFVRVRVKGEFPRAGTMQFISSELVERARRREPEAYIDDPFTMAVDVARFGDDATVISHKRGRDCKSLPWTRLRGADTMEVAARVAQLYETHRHDAVFVDGGGVGGGVIDRLRMLRVPVIEVQFGGKADRSSSTSAGPIIYANKRSEMYGYLRDAMSGLAIPDDSDLASELVSIEYTYRMQDGKDAILLEKKSDMKKRGLPSPDHADSLALHFAYPVMKSDHRQQLAPHTVPSAYENYHPLSRDVARKVGGNYTASKPNPYYRSGRPPQ